MTVALAYDGTLSRVRIVADGLSDAAPVEIQRSTDQIRWSTVRGGAAVVPAGGVVKLGDYEFTPGTANFYRVVGPAMVDTFTRTVTGSWGVADTGQVWSGAQSQLSVDGSAGLVTHDAAGQSVINITDLSAGGDTSMRADIRLPVLAVGDSFETGLIPRYADGSHYYLANLVWQTDGTLDLLLISNVAGFTTVASTTLPITYTGAETITVEAELVGVTFRARAWIGGVPGGWDVEATVSGVASGSVAVRSRRNSGNTSGAVATRWDDLVVSAPTVSDSSAVGAPLNTNPFFEVDVSGWTSTGGTAARSTAQAHEGTASLLLTPDGASAEAKIESFHAPITAGTYRSGAWVYCATSRAVQVQIAWYDATSAWISSLSTTVTVPAGAWTYVQASGVAPAAATEATVVVRMTGTPAAADLLYVDEAELRQVTPAQITPTIDRVWLKSLARPFLNRAVTVLDFGDEQFPSRAGVFDVIGRSFPVVVNEVRGSRRWTVEVLTETAEESRNVELLLASGDTLLVQVPADVDIPGGYVTVGNVDKRRTARRTPRRVFALPCIEVAPPGPDVVPATATWQSIINNYATWDDVLAAFPTWADVLEYIASPTDVVVP